MKASICRGPAILREQHNISTYIVLIIDAWFLKWFDIATKVVRFLSTISLFGNHIFANLSAIFEFYWRGVSRTSRENRNEAWNNTVMIIWEIGHVNAPFSYWIFAMLIGIHCPAKTICLVDADFWSILKFDTLHSSLVFAVLGLKFNIKAIIVWW